MGGWCVFFGLGWCVVFGVVCFCVCFGVHVTPESVLSGVVCVVVLRWCPTLPHPVGCSTIGAVGLSFRVRDGSGRFPHAVTAARWSTCVTPFLFLVFGVVGWSWTV